MGKKLNQPDPLAELLALRPDLVQRFARLRCGRADAEDLAQSTLIRGVRSLHTYRSEGELRRWAMGVANNVYRRHRRTVRRRSKLIVTEPEAAVEAFAPGPAPDVSAQLGEARQRLYAAVDAMPDVLFEVFFLVYLEEYTLEEARKELRISKNAVKMRALRVRRYLRREMRDFRDAYYSVVPPMPPSGPLTLVVQRCAPMLGHVASVIMAALLLLPSPRDEAPKAAYFGVAREAHASAAKLSAASEAALDEPTIEPPEATLANEPTPEPQPRSNPPPEQHVEADVDIPEGLLVDMP
ncbi:RNA polymerase sigma factor [Polyangium sorediatum]|uniref:RNA polymerase sigma factor n=1 Tax=Polyangium sorediatum TaxID=889274 RepID=A0ABT6P2X4_9BACT|nr:RNA polymerase sigma factor [Polyangium sorediatum]MDI1434913.1 RNA polymerase sigma factor [Polyangium sorediatum]